MMNGLVALIVLAYLLIIAVCVAIWSAVSLRRSAPEATTARRASGERRPEVQAGHRGSKGRRPQAHGETHDAYRGARAARAAVPVPQPDATAASAPRVRVRATRSPATQDRLFAPDGTPVPELPTGGVRVAESHRARERAAPDDAPDAPSAERSERGEREDPFDRFLRANRDFER